jgi:hypothetical protein
MDKNEEIKMKTDVEHARIKNKAFSSGIMFFDIASAPVLDEESIKSLSP